MTYCSHESLFLTEKITKKIWISLVLLEDFKCVQKKGYFLNSCIELIFIICSFMFVAQELGDIQVDPLGGSTRPMGVLPHYGPPLVKNQNMYVLNVHAQIHDFGMLNISERIRHLLSSLDKGLFICSHYQSSIMNNYKTNKISAPIIAIPNINF